MRRTSISFPKSERVRADDGSRPRRSDSFAARGEVPMVVPLIQAVQHRDVGSMIGMIASWSRTFLSAHPRLAIDCSSIS
jgi:hypothetical protein